MQLEDRKYTLHPKRHHKNDECLCGIPAHQNRPQESVVDFLDQSFTPLELSHANQDSPTVGWSDFLELLDGLLAEGQLDNSTVKREQRGWHIKLLRAYIE